MTTVDEKKGWPEGYVEANGIRLHYWRTGDGSKPAVVMCHGFSDNGLCWRPVAQRLQDAFDIFERLHVPLWADRARSELVRASVGPRQTGQLTPSEQRVAELAASGMKNRDVAAALFISPKTVEANLARVYRKLGIKSRAELGRHIGRPGNGAEARPQA